MRAIFVNHCHPDSPHVCGTRAREFANALARQGHRIILHTECLDGANPAVDPASLPSALAAHDWSVPFRLAVSPRASPLLQAVRGGRLPAALRIPVIAYQYVVRGGMFTDWRAASQPFWQPLAEAFKPDVVWGVFGNTDAWAIAQGIAHAAGCPWVRDVKDRWGGFIPAPLRPAVARRFSDARSTTALSQSLLDDASPWLRGEREVIYSGVPKGLTHAPRPAGQPFTVVLIGGTYVPALLEVFMKGVADHAAARGSIRVLYAGTDGDAVAAAAGRCGVAVDIRGLLPWKEYWALVSQADINAYIRIAGQEWHHKIVELLAARRPILCVAGEIEEARTLVREAGGSLYEAGGASHVMAVLDEIRNRPAPGDTVGSVPDVLTWDRQADRLLAALRAAV